VATPDNLIEQFGDVKVRFHIYAFTILQNSRSGVLVERFEGGKFLIYFFFDSIFDHCCIITYPMMF
jgi:hypothetical protein